jgi:hypothetical protein
MPPEDGQPLTTPSSSLDKHFYPFQSLVPSTVLSIMLLLAIFLFAIESEVKWLLVSGLLFFLLVWLAAPLLGSRVSGGVFLHENGITIQRLFGLGKRHYAYEDFRRLFLMPARRRLVFAFQQVDSIEWIETPVFRSETHLESLIDTIQQYQDNASSEHDLMEHYQRYLQQRNKQFLRQIVPLLLLFFLSLLLFIILLSN